MLMKIKGVIGIEADSPQPTVKTKLALHLSAISRELLAQLSQLGVFSGEI
jgi:hypothetical protein